MPDPDLTTATLADAAQLAGPEFVEFVAEVRADATAVADELAPLGPDGAELATGSPSGPVPRGRWSTLPAVR